MARISGNVNADASQSSNTGKHNWSAVYTGTEYMITFTQAFSETPTVLAHEINYDFRANNAPLVIRIVPRKDGASITFLDQNTGGYVAVQFGFAAFGD